MKRIARRTLARMAAAAAGVSQVLRAQQQVAPEAQWSGKDNPELIAAALKNVPPLPGGPVEPTWDSVRAHYQVPDWFRDAKFGIMMHWGVYSVPAHQSEWYVRYMYGGNAGIMQWHTEHFGPPTKFGYKDFIPKYTAANWDPDAWAQLFKKAGARYVLASGEHHDGFSNWDSAINRFNAKNMGPKRDIVGDLTTAVRKAGLQAGVANHSSITFQFRSAARGQRSVRSRVGRFLQRGRSQ